MEWNIVKLDILAMAFDAYDPVSSHNFILQISNYKEIDEFGNAQKSKDYVLLMLYELINEGLADIHISENGIDKKFDGTTQDEVKDFLRKINVEWKKINYSMPNWDELFTVIATNKGKEYYKLNETNLD